ncbi:prenyltransferase [Ruminococcaceae bacterium OttesenSCG-928-I18]|nr:prenyltransferase [Ruminococcaceae bacterium OttesenSCG-928-I18]
MAVEEAYTQDVQAILSHRYDNGADYWTTEDKRLLKGSPFSAYNSALMLLELGVEPDDPVLQKVAQLFLDAWRQDGRFRLYPGGAIYACHTTPAAYLLCRLGYAEDPRLQKTFGHLLKTRYTDGGWRCNKFSFGRGPETEYSNAWPTLVALNAFRLSGFLNREPELDEAVEFLLRHWEIRRPIGPCHYGIGTRFMQVAYPFGDYNLFLYVYVLSFYDRAKDDRRFKEAFEALRGKLVDGQVVVERVVPKLAKLHFCKKGEPSELATRRYHEILKNLEREN